MPQVNIDGLTVDVDDVATAKVINDALKASAARADSAQTQLALFQADADKEDGKVPPAFLKHMKKKKGEEKDEDENDDADDDDDDNDDADDDDTRSAHDAEMSAMRSERDALQGQLDALYADEEDDEEDNDDADPEQKGELKGKSKGSSDPEQKDELKGKSKSSKEDSRNDSDRQAWFETRQELVGVATSLRLDSFETLNNSELRRAIVAEHTGKDVSDYSSERIDGAMPHIIAKVAARQDSLDRASKALLPGHGEQRKDAQSDYRTRLLNASKRTQ